MRDIVKQKFSNEMLDYIIDWIKNSVDVEDVFDINELEEWAENNGYVKEE